VDQIEGKTKGFTSPKDKSGLKRRWIELSHEQINAIEAQAIFKAQKKHLLARVSSPQRWFQPSYLLNIHYDMLSSVWEWAGKLRKSAKNIGIKAYEISTQLHLLCEDVLFWNNNPVELTFLEQSCHIHHRLALIHPFEDGNGRFSRLVADRYLKAHQCPYPIWPDYLHDDCKARSEYISALRKADQHDIEPLVNFVQKYGAKDPTVNELEKSILYAKMSVAQKAAIKKAFLRRGL
jgi:Fic-DOC domain mobile mystery protein B